MTDVDERILIGVDELVQQIHRGQVSESSKVVLQRLAVVLDSDVRFCRFKSCGKPFVPKKQNHEYCCCAHSDKDWNATRRYEQKTV